jgi:LmbE family N-acetylglucosaminyl deacetylase
MAKIVCVFAHPDDEAITTGGTLRMLVDKGHEVYYICATRGEASTAYDREYVKFEDIPEYRTRELKEAVKILGGKELVFMDYLDGTLPDVDADEAVNVLVNKFNEVEPDIVITFEKNGISHHKDHKVVHQWVMDAVRSSDLKSEIKKIYLTTIDSSYGRLKNGLVMGHSPEQITAKVDISSVVNVKTKAILAHRTQLRSLEKNGLVVDGKLARNHKYEYFILVDKDGNKIDVKEEFLI